MGSCAYFDTSIVAKIKVKEPKNENDIIKTKNYKKFMEVNSNNKIIVINKFLEMKTNLLLKTNTDYFIIKWKEKYNNILRSEILKEIEDLFYDYDDEYDLYIEENIEISQEQIKKINKISNLDLKNLNIIEKYIIIDKIIKTEYIYCCNKNEISTNITNFITKYSIIEDIEFYLEGSGDCE